MRIIFTYHLETNVENGIMFEMYTDRGFIQYNASSINTENGLPELFKTYSPGPVWDDHGITRWGYSGVRGFSVSEDKLVVAAREDGYQYPTVRFFVNNDHDYFDLTDSVAFYRNDSLPNGIFEDCLISGNYVYALYGHSSGSDLFVFNATNWNNPILISTLTIPGDSRGGVTQPSRYLRISNGILFFYNGLMDIHIINLTSPSEPSWINTIDSPAVVQDMELRNNRLYIAGGKLGLWVYNISDSKNISLLKSYSKSIQDVYTIVTFNETATYVGNKNGTVQLIDIKDNEDTTDLIQFGSFPCETLYIWNEMLFIGTTGFYTHVYDITNPNLPFYLTNNSMQNYLPPREQYIMHVQTSLDNYAHLQEYGTCPELQMYINLFGDDFLNITRRYDARIYPHYLILYNDTDRDGYLTVEVNRSEIAKNYIESCTFSDEIYALPSYNCSSYEYTDPIVRDYKGTASLYYNVTWYSWSLLAKSSSSYYGLPEDLNIHSNNDLNVSFDLTYGFWFIPENNETYNLKIDTILGNINLDFGSQSIPSNLKLHSGFLTSLNTIYGSTSLPIPTRVNNNTYAQEFGMEGNVVALSTMENWYLRKNSSNPSDWLNETCVKSAIPRYIDHDNQKVMGDSDHIYQWLLGANFIIDNETDTIIYDPETTFFTANPYVEKVSGDENGGGGGSIEQSIISYDLPLLMGISGITISIIWGMYLKIWKKVKKNG